MSSSTDPMDVDFNLSSDSKKYITEKIKRLVKKGAEDYVAQAQGKDISWITTDFLVSETHRIAKLVVPDYIKKLVRKYPGKTLNEIIADEKAKHDEHNDDVLADLVKNIKLGG